MRRSLPVIAAVLAALAVVPSHAGADDTSATIMLPIPFVGTGQSGEVGAFDCTPDEADCDKGPYAGVYRRLYINAPSVAQSGSTGTLGFVIPITRRNVPFTLRSEPPNTADFDLNFYRTLGDPPNGAPDDYPDGTRTLFARFGNGPETGTVPPGTNFAIITLWGSANATFSYSS